MRYLDSTKTAFLSTDNQLTRSIYLSVEDGYKQFERRNWMGKRQIVQALKGVDLTIFKGETLGLVGESGSGKSTLGRAILGLDPLTSGQVKTADGGLPEKNRHKKMQIIYQDPYSALNPFLTALELVEEPIRHLPKANRRQRAVDCLTQVGLTGDDFDKLPRSFSGGQRQRIGIARAVVNHPDFIVLDEPTSALDVSIQLQILNLLKSLQTEYNLTYLFISHDLAVIRHICDRIAVLYHGQIVEVAPSEELFLYAQHPYTKKLLGSLLEADPRKAREKLHQAQQLSTIEIADNSQLVCYRPNHYVRRNEDVGSTS